MTVKACQERLDNFFLFLKKFIYLVSLAALGLSCGTRDLLVVA